MRARLRRTLAWSAAVAILGGAGAAIVALGPGKDGQPSFTPGQIQEGRKIYAQTCAVCHGADLLGGAGPALTGLNFTKGWADGTHSVAQLYTALRRMPANAPDSLSADQYLGLVAYILSRNGYQAGPTPLEVARLNQPLPPPARAEAEGPPDHPLVTDLPKLVYAAPGLVAGAPSDAELLAPKDADWLMYNRDYAGHRYSALAQINAGNAGRLTPVCILQLGELGAFQASPVVYKGRAYVTTWHSTYAFDATNCKRLWTHQYIPQDVEGGPVNRGVALYKGKLFRGTGDGHLIALDAATGKLLWDSHVADSTAAYFLSAAPVVFQNRVLIGLAGADWGANGHMYAFDADTGKLFWTFDFIPTGKQPGAETWVKGAEHGGGSTWSSVAIDVAKGLVYVPIGNPAPDLDVEMRPGSNLYTNSVVALDVRTGKLAWYVQQVAADYHDWDTAAAPVLYEQNGRRYMAVASKSGWLYIYDRDTHKLVAKSEVSKHVNADVPLSATPVYVCPGYLGGTEWNGPAYDPTLKTLFVNSVEWCNKLHLERSAYVRGKAYVNGVFDPDPRENTSGWLRAFDAASGRELWKWAAPRPMVAGATPTAGGVVFTGGTDGDFLVFESATGRQLYRFNTGGSVAGGVSTYEVGGRQYVAVTSGNRSRSRVSIDGAPTVVVFALPATP